jgi:hypothetical protein
MKGVHISNKQPFKFISSCRKGINRACDKHNAPYRTFIDNLTALKIFYPYLNGYG